MKSNVRHITTLNAISNIILQFVTIISGLIIPKFLISSLGSDVNGLVSSLTQFLNLMLLFEGGLGSVILAHLYHPLVHKDHQRLSQVVKTINKFYKELSYLFIAYGLIVGTIYPIITQTPFTFSYIFTLTLIIAFSAFVQYNLTTPLKLILNADKKVYIVSFTQTFIVILNTIASVAILLLFPEIHLVKITTVLIYLLQPAILSHFTHKFYNIDKTAPHDPKLLSSRWSGLGISIAAFLHYNADVIILTIFTNLATVSVYSVYALVTTGLRQVLVAISSGMLPTLGNIYAAKDTKKLADFFSRYEITIFLCTSVLFSVGGLLITPFVMLYTSGVTDANYYQPALGILLIIAEAIFCLREPYVNMAYSANRFKDITKYAIIEASLNVVISVALVAKFGVVGVAIGTLIAMLYRTTFHILYLPKIIAYHLTSSIKKLATFITPLAISIPICYIVAPPQIHTWWQWIICGCIYTIIIGITVSTSALIVYGKSTGIFKKIVQKGDNHK